MIGFADIWPVSFHRHKGDEENNFFDITSEALDLSSDRESEGFGGVFRIFGGLELGFGLHDRYIINSGQSEKQALPILYKHLATCTLIPVSKSSVSSSLIAAWMPSIDLSFLA